MGSLDQTPPATPVAAEEVVELCRDLIRIDTSNYGPDGGPGERAAAEYVAAKLDEVGIESRLFESEPGRTTVVARWEPEGVDRSVPPLLIHGHLDVVPADAADWTFPPFAAEVHDGMIWGRGAVDMKDMDAMVLSVVRQRQREGRPPRRPIRLVFTADEESGGIKGSVWLTHEHPETISDCTESISEVGGFSLTIRDDLRLYLIATAEKGVAWLRLIAEGTAGHGSMRNDDNAITRLAGAVSRIGSYHWPVRLHPAQAAFIRELEDVLGTKIEYDSVEETLAHLGGISRMVGATMRNLATPTMLRAGYKDNVVPGRAEAAVDARYLPGFREELLDTIAELAGPGVRTEIFTELPAREAEYAGGLVEAMKASLQEEDRFARPIPYLLSAGTDAKGFGDLGIRNYGFVPLQLPPDLDFTGLFHSVDERVPIESLRFGTRVLDRFLDLA